MLLFFPAWPAATPAFPAPVAADLALLAGTATGLSAKQQDAALKRVAAALRKHAPSDPALAAFTSAHLAPWAVAALLDPRNAQSRTALTYFCNSVAQAVPAALPALADAVAAGLPAALAPMDLVEQYAALQALARFEFGAAGLAPHVAGLLAQWGSTIDAVVAASADGEDVVPAVLADVTLALKLVVLVLPKTPVGALPAAAYAALRDACQALLCARVGDLDTKRLVAVVVTQLLVTHPGARAAADPPVADPAAAACEWALTLAPLPHAAMLRALLACVAAPAAHGALIGRVTRGLLEALDSDGGRDIAVKITLFDALVLAAGFLSEDDTDLALAVLDVAWAHFEDASDMVQLKAKNVCEALLSKLPADALAATTDRALACHPLTKVRYTMLALLVPVVGASALWGRDAEVLAAAFDAVARPNVVGRVADFLKEWIASVDAAGRTPEFMGVYARLVGGALLSADPLVRKHTISHILRPMVAQLPALYPALSPVLHTSDSPLALAATVALERVARTLELATTTPVSSLMRACAAPSPALRLDALGLLSDVRRHTQPFTRDELAWLRVLLRDNLADASAEFRDSLMARLAKVLDRIRNSGYALGRAARVTQGPPEVLAAAEDARGVLAAYREFVEWLLAAVTAGLGPGVPYPRAMTALQVMHAAVTAFGVESVPMPPGFNAKHCATPVFPFAVDVDRAAHLHAVLNVLRASPYEDIQNLAHAVLRHFRFPADMVPVLRGWAERGVASPRGSEAHVGALMFDLMFQTCERHGVKLAQDGPDGVFDNFVHHLTASIQAQTAQTATDLLAAAHSAPLPGTLLALQMVLARAPAAAVTHLAGPLVDLVTRACAPVLPILCEAAPEGNLPDAVRDDEEDEAAVEDLTTASASSQLILSFSWRVVKHACDLVGTLVASLDPAAAEALLVRVGEYFITLMLQIRHRGAFCAVSPNLVRVCEKLAAVSAKPLAWLKDTLASVANDDFSVTRRSGGLPYVIQALVTAPGCRNWLPVAMDHLFSLASATVTAVQVNAMNTLRRLIDDRHLARDAAASVEAALVLAMGLLHHGDWAVRNGALMLYSSLLNRVFGTKVVRDQDHVLNKVTAKDFFARFPRLHAALVARLGEAAREDKTMASLFPYLTLLARLAPATLDATATAALADFANHVRACAGSPVWKVREMAADANVALVPRDAAVGAAHALLRDAVAVVGNHNEVHGLLLQARALVRSIPDASAAVLDGDLVRGAVQALRAQRASNYALAVAVQIAAHVLGAAFAADAAAWFTSGDVRGLGRELLQVHLAQAAVLGNGPAVLETLLVETDAPLVHVAVMEALAESHLAHLTPLPARVVARILIPSASQGTTWSGLQMQVIQRYALPVDSGVVLRMAADPAQVPLSVSSQLVKCLAQCIAGAQSDQVPALAARFLELLGTWADPDQPLPLRDAVAHSLDPVLAALLAHPHPAAVRGTLLRTVHRALALLALDDDDDVRALASAVLSSRLTGTAVHYGAVAGVVRGWLAAQHDAADVLADEWRADIEAHLRVLEAAREAGGRVAAADAAALFYKEDPNLYRDRMEEVRGIVGLLEKGGCEVEGFKRRMDEVAKF
ncbi:hypothetical protein H9P43_009712 [Blastocladiella emersonii ATCC 22665]|nr:hypothetical protein H9P43_009712 [Blastocladiella emersonii ATCC 22665]